LNSDLSPQAGRGKRPRFPCWRYADLVGRSLLGRARLLRTTP
jgi:hypothetical protein